MHKDKFQYYLRLSNRKVVGSKTWKLSKLGRTLGHYRQQIYLIGNAFFGMSFILEVGTLAIEIKGKMLLAFMIHT